MPNRVTLKDPGVMEAILEDIAALPREYWLEAIARYDNEKPGDIILPGIPPRAPFSHQPIVLQVVTPRPVRAKRRTPKQKAA